MKLAKIKTRRIGGLFLEVLMLVFVFASSWSQASFVGKELQGELIIKSSPVEQLVFRDSDSFSESLLEFTSKVKVFDSEFVVIAANRPDQEIKNTEAFSINQSLYNIFYTHTTASAP